MCFLGRSFREDDWAWLKKDQTLLTLIQVVAMLAMESTTFFSFVQSYSSNKDQIWFYHF